MDLLSVDDCKKIVERNLGISDLQIISYNVRSSSEAGAGFMGATRTLFITINRHGKKTELSFFTKILPDNDYHRRNVDESRVFYKEAEFFKSICPSLSKYFTQKVTPTCYHSDAEKILVFENLADQGFRNADAQQFFNMDQCKAVLSKLASLHAASLLYEKEMGSSIDELFPHLMCNQIAWFKNKPGHPGYEHLQTRLRALGDVLDTHFGHVAVEERTKVKNLLASNPTLLLPSKRYRNVLTHSDMWCNNVMFKYNERNEIEDCVLVDYQLFGYCPPSVDVYSIIFAVSDKDFRNENMEVLTHYWYKKFSECIQHYGAKTEELLTYSEFKESSIEALPLALTNAVIFLHHVLIPEDVLVDVFSNIDTTRKFMETDRTPIILDAIEKHGDYRERVFATLNDCIDYVSGKLSV